MAPRLPTELFERVMDNLCCNRDALGICGLVSPQWTPRSRHHLFSTVDLSFPKIPLFIDLLSSPACTFVLSVSRLSLDAIGATERFVRLVTSPAFGRLAYVKSLRLANIDWTTFPRVQQVAIESGLARLKQLTTLEMHALSFHELKGALTLAGLFPALSRIHLIDIRFSKYLEYNISAAKTYRIPPTWEFVEIDAGDAIPAFLHCFCLNLAVAPLGIRSLKLLHIEEEHYSYIHGLRLIEFKSATHNGGSPFTGVSSLVLVSRDEECASLVLLDCEQHTYPHHRTLVLLGCHCASMLASKLPRTRVVCERLQYKYAGHLLFTTSYNKSSRARYRTQR
ncbi:hypothetical protein GGX14DRAFT_672127 [Mycena pura]|uniref:F-box domain-containing protein n=1 Tax=Mycena pura TaxID=153505 RepID=A0AAD6Y8Z0_9AGAR|nr:hypothetical protein GGX14DRAFT_672127 [Mycena pura]